MTSPSATRGPFLIAPGVCYALTQVKRIVLAVAVALLAAQASGLSSWVLPATCDEGCEDDAQGTCSPTCACCTCCFHPRSYARRDAARALAQPPAVRPVVFSVWRAPDAPPPREIFRVPKASVA